MQPRSCKTQPPGVCNSLVARPACALQPRGCRGLHKPGRRALHKLGRLEGCTSQAGEGCKGYQPSRSVSCAGLVCATLCNFGVARHTQGVQLGSCTCRRAECRNSSGASLSGACGGREKSCAVTLKSKGAKSQFKFRHKVAIQMAPN